MLQKGIQLLNFSQNKKQSTYNTVTNYDNLKIITCANTDGIINGFVTVFAQHGGISLRSLTRKAGQARQFLGPAWRGVPGFFPDAASGYAY